MARKRRRNATQTAPPGGLSAGVALTELERRQRRINLIAERAAANANAGEPTPEQLRRNRYASIRTHDPETGFPIIVKRNATAWAIDRYRARDQLTETQHRAARQYRDDYDRGGYERPITGRYEGGGGGSDGTPNMTGMMAANNAQLDARDRLRKARAVLPVRLAAAFDAMVLHEDDAKIVGELDGRTGAQAARFAIEWLRICCDELIEFYRL